MTITFENENDVIVYAFEKVISYARRNQQIFVAQCIWWLASIIGLEQGLIVYIDNQRKRESVQVLSARKVSSTPRDLTEDQRYEQTIQAREVSSTPRDLTEDQRYDQTIQAREVSSTPRDLTEDQRYDQIVQNAEVFIQESSRSRTALQGGRLNPIPLTKNQLKKARKAKRLQDGIKKGEIEKNHRLLRRRNQNIKNFSKD